MVYKKIITETALRDLKRIDKTTSVRIIKKLEWYLELENPLEHAKKLINTNIDTYRFRIGDYRAVFTIDEKTRAFVVLMILRIIHRKEDYKNL